MSIALYIGAGRDVRPIRYLKDVKTFIYVDSQPESEFPGVYDNYNHNFIQDFEYKIVLMGFEPCGCGGGGFYSYVKKDVTVKYYFNMAFPDKMSNSLRADIARCDSLILAGYDPDQSVLDMMSKPVRILLWSNSCYNLEDCEENSTVARVTRDKTDISRIEFYKKEYVKMTLETL